jgi:hypothetical protein
VQIRKASVAPDGLFGGSDAKHHPMNLVWFYQCKSLASKKGDLANTAGAHCAMNDGCGPQGGNNEKDGDEEQNNGDCRDKCAPTPTINCQRLVPDDD